VLMRSSGAQPNTGSVPQDILPTVAKNNEQLIAIGASTGGVEALQVLLTALPKNMPPILITQHIPPAFSARLANRLDAQCKLSVVEAKDGQKLEHGVVYIAQGGRQLKVKRLNSVWVCCVDDSPPVNLHRPSVDVLFSSLRIEKVKKPVAIMLTGMGDDGAQAMLHLKQESGFTIAQDKESSLIWGMPGAAVDIGAAVKVLPLHEIPAALIKHLAQS